MFHFLHGYAPGLWEAQVNAGLVRPQDGIRFCQSLEIRPERKFNELAKKGGTLYEILRERRCPLLIDRLQGGSYITDYVYDPDLVHTYEELLGDRFYGFQMHEWLSNYYSDACGKLAELPATDWNEENIARMILEKFPGKHLFLESMTLSEMAAGGKPETPEAFWDNMTAVYRKRRAVGELVPCDSVFMNFGFELDCGARILMPEVGNQVRGMRKQMAFARGMTRGRAKFAAYYEPWGGKPFSACFYNGQENEWGLGENSDFPFKTAGPNGGSSRSLQSRVLLYAFLSGAEYVCEEWGLYNTFLPGEDFPLSPYGTVKRDFLRLTERRADLGEKLAPAAAILPKEMRVVEVDYEPDRYLHFPCSANITRSKRKIRELFDQSVPMLGTESTALRNWDLPDAIDLLQEREGLERDYGILVDLTGDGAFAHRHPDCCTPEELPLRLRQFMPCSVTGDFHWVVNRRIGGGYYLTVMNHSGVIRTVAEGERFLPEAASTGTVTFRNGETPELCEGNGTLERRGSEYYLTVPAGGFAMMSF